MDLRLRVIIIVTCICSVLFFFDFIRREKITLRISLPWLLCIAITCLLAIFPQLIDVVSYVLGIANPMNALFFCAIVFLITVVFFCYLTASKSSTRSVRLIQEVAILQCELRNAHRKGEEREQS